MNQHAQQLFFTLQTLFPTSYQKASFRALMALFLRGDGRPRLSHNSNKSASALSRFFNQYRWNTRSIIRQTRQAAIASLLSTYGKKQGRRPRLVVMIDLSTLEKTGHFKKLDLMSILNKKRGIHVVVMYLVVGPLRVPWSFRLWRGKGEASASVLALKLLRQLPQPLTQQFGVLVLADGGFGNICFLEGIHKLGLDAVVGMRSDRVLEDGRQASEVRSGTRVIPTGLSFPVTVARYRLKRKAGCETRVVVATFAAKGHIISRWGKRRWRIEGFFKTAKSRFGLARFGQQTLPGVLRFLVLSLLAFMLSQWHLWSMPEGEWPDWGAVATGLRRLLVPDLVHAELQAELERLRPYLKAAGVSGL
jgi:hypothetical protein